MTGFQLPLTSIPSNAPPVAFDFDSVDGRISYNNEIVFLRLPMARSQGVLVLLALSPSYDGASCKVCQTCEPTDSNGSGRDRGERESTSPSVGWYSGFRLTPSSGRCSPRGAKPEKSKACLRVGWFPTFPSYSSWLVQVKQQSGW